MSKHPARPRPDTASAHALPSPELRYRPILDLAAVGFTVACYGIARLAFNGIGNRVFGVAAVGAVNVAMSTALLLSLPVSAGLAPAVLRFLPMRHGTARRRQQAWLLALAAGWIVLAASALGLLRFGFPRLSWLPLPAGVVETWCAAYCLYSVGRAWLFATGRVRGALGVEVGALALFAGTLALASAWPTAYWTPLVAYYLPGVAVALAVALSSSRDLARSSYDPEVGAFAGYSLLGSVASLGVTYASTVVVALVADVAGAGVWATLVSAVSPFLLVPRSMNTLFLPRLSREGEAGASRFRDLSSTHQIMSSGLAATFLAPAVLLGRHVAPAVLGLEYDARTGLVWVLVCAAVYATTRGEPIVTATAALGRVRWSSSVSIAVGAIVVLYWFLAAPGRGIVAVAIGYAAFTSGVPLLLAALWSVLDRGETRGPRLLPNFGDLAFAVCLVLALAGRGVTALDVVVALGAALAAGAWAWRRYRRAAGLALLAEGEP